MDKATRGKRRGEKGATHPHDLDEKENVDEEDNDGRTHIYPVRRVGDHPRTVGQERLQVQFLLPKDRRKQTNQ